MNKLLRINLALFAGGGLGILSFAQAGGAGATPPAPLRVSTTIGAPPAKVWQLLTTPSSIKQWFLGVDTETDWKVGSPLVHRGEYNGKPYESKGVVKQFDPPRTLVHTHWSATSGLPDQPENYQVVRYELVARGAGTELTVTEENLAGDEKRKISEQTWQKVLGNLKAMAEK